MTERNIALKLGDRWTFHAPGEALVPFGMCDKYDEGAVAVMLTGEKSLFGPIPVSPAEASQIQRQARLTLQDDGTLAGDVTITYTGHEAIDERRDARDESDDELAKQVREQVSARLTGAEVSDVKWENLRESAGPVVLRYKVTVPNYAELAGQRIVLTPSFFTHGRKPLFTAAERQNKLMWANAWQDRADVEIALPAGYALEEATSPQPVKEESGLLAAEYTLAYAKRRHAVLFKRQFTFDGTKGLLFASSAYPSFKMLYERVHQSDAHSVVLRPAAPATDAPPAAPATPAAPANAAPAS
jgi:hypothetical protein